MTAYLFGSRARLVLRWKCDLSRQALLKNKLSLLGPGLDRAVEDGEVDTNDIDLILVLGVL